MSDVILTSDCEKCRYGNIKEISKALIKTTCELRPDKEYYFGQYITCNCFEKKVEE